MPSASPVKDRGDVQVPHAPVVPSRHSNVADGSLVKAKLASRTPIAPDGPDVIVVSGSGAATSVGPRTLASQKETPQNVARWRAWTRT